MLVTQVAILATVVEIAGAISGYSVDHAAPAFTVHVLVASKKMLRKRIIFIDVQTVTLYMQFKHPHSCFSRNFM